MTPRDVYNWLPKWIHTQVARVQHCERPFDYLARCLPKGLRTKFAPTLERLDTRYFFWRIGRRPTNLLGPLWRRSRERAEIDLTYSCNLKCFNCNRSCEQDPSNDHLSIAQISQFLDESREAGNPWKLLQVVGGEPTNHPQFVEIMNLLVEYRDKHSPATKIELTSNGYGERVNRMLGLVPPGVQINNTSKTTQVQTEFCTFNVAPVDVKEYAAADFSNGCFVTQLCGTGVTPYGYYPCAIAGAIDRTFGLNLGRKTLPKADDSMEPELRKFCALCGHFKHPTGEVMEGPVMSSTWAAAYARSRKEPPTLARLPEHGGLVQIST